MSLEYMEKLPDLIKEGNVSKLRECISRMYGDSISDKKNIDRIFDIPAEILTVIKLSDFIDAIYEGSYYESEEEDLLKKAVENKIGDINFIGRKFDLPYIIYMLQKFNIDKEDYAQTLFDISVKSNRYSDVLYCINNLNINIDCIHYIEASDGYSTLKLKLIEKLKENGKIKLMAETLSNDGDNLLHIISKRLVVSRIEENMKACDISQKDLKKMSLAKNNANNTPFYEFLLTVKNRTKKPDGPYENILNNLIKDGDLNLFFSLYEDKKSLEKLAECNNKGENLKSILDSHSFWPEKLRERISLIVVKQEKNLLDKIIVNQNTPKNQNKKTRI